MLVELMVKLDAVQADTVVACHEAKTAVRLLAEEVRQLREENEKLKGAAKVAGEPPKA
jgi:hypothetical protein